VSRIPAAARWCALVAFANALVWSLVTPPFHVPDETVHVSYVQYLAETGRIPNKPGAAVFSSQEAALLDSLRFNSVVGNERDRPTYTEAQARGVTAVDESDRSRVSGGGISEASSQPPLFYAYESIGYLASPWGGLLERVWLMRLMSALLCAATVVFVYLFLRELLSEPWTWTVGALAVAFQPLFGFVGSGISPDSLLFTSSAALFWALARAFRRGLTPARGAGIGAALAVGLMTKLNVVALLPGVFVGVVLLLWRGRRAESLRPAALGAAVACAIPAAVSAVYIALNLLVWDRTAWGGGVAVAARTATGTGSHAADAITLADQLSYTWQLYLPRLPFMEREFFQFPGWETWYRGFIGEFGWLDTTFDLWVYRVSLLVTVPMVLLAVAALVRRRVALRARLPEILTYAALVGGILVSIGVLGLRYRRNTGFEFEQARYLLPFLPLYGALVAAAAAGAGRRLARPVGALLVAFAAVHGLFAQLLVISRYYG
jgi:4-amino-4-deoxy-L-arabinose transferase-like glycosyltransferase